MYGTFDNTPTEKGQKAPNVPDKGIGAGLDGDTGHTGTLEKGHTNGGSIGGNKKLENDWA